MSKDGVTYYATQNGRIFLNIQMLTGSELGILYSLLMGLIDVKFSVSFSYI
jgi:hypothetical protein